MVTGWGRLGVPEVGDVLRMALEEEEAKLADFLSHLHTHDLTLAFELSDRVRVG
jgi:hypothetical protein